MRMLIATVCVGWMAVAGAAETKPEKKDSFAKADEKATSCGTFYAFWVSPDASGKSGGYLAAGGPAYGGLRDL